ncbi:PAS domain S-box protein [bacterium]|nr:PAS domain S-box protein [candidate division CSSED10-310 bacterium]
MDATQTKDETDFYQKLKSLIIARLLVGTTLLLGTALPLEVSGFFAVSRFLFPLVTTILIMTIIYSGLLNITSNLRLLACIQLLGDILLETIIIMATGGIESPFSILYVITIIIASYVIPRKGSFATAIFISLVFGGIVVCQYKGWTGWWPFATNWVLLPPPTFAVYIILVNIAGYYLTAFLANNLSERIRRMNLMLLNRNVQYSYLWTLNRRIVNEIPSGVITTTAEGDILSVNPAAITMLGLVEEPDQQYRLSRIFPDYLVQSILRMASLDQSVKREIQYQYELTGETYWILIEIIALERKTRDPARLMLIVNDVTDQKRIEEMKRKTQRWSTVAEVSAGMAHEIRNPLASISGSIEVLKQQLKLTDSQNRLMNIVIRESDRLNKLISNFLDLARPRKPEFNIVDLEALLEEITMLVKTSESFNETITIDFQRSMEPLDVEIDRDQITQMIWNLLKNAIEAMPDGGTVHICARVCHEPGPYQKVLDTQPKPPFVRCSIEDTGIGMDQEVISRIFDPFTTFKRHGVGIGLAIVYRIVENHHGTIRVMSKLKKGTTFIVDLPFRQKELPEDKEEK